jgi:hypothetical protein
LHSLEIRSTESDFIVVLKIKLIPNE